MPLQKSLEAANLRLKKDYLEYDFRYSLHFLDQNKKCAFVGRNYKLMESIARTFCNDVVEGRDAVRISFNLLDAVNNNWSLKELMIRKLEKKCQKEQEEMPKRNTDDKTYIDSLINTLSSNHGHPRKIVLLFLNFQLCYHVIEQGDTPEFIFLRELNYSTVYVCTLSILDLEKALDIGNKGNSVLAPCTELIMVDGDRSYNLSEIQEACKITQE